MQMGRPGRNSQGLEECTEICYKDPVFKDHQWSAYIDRSPGSASYSEECFHACVSGCGFKFDVEPEKADKIQPNRPAKPVPVVSKPSPRPPIAESIAKNEDLPSTSA
ncbi:uncharacterized protein LOC120074406 isoform X2 [Benincasa hispida]|uniref:uncharacterized protein LOC120074406 isoform X2 n=1 Tax=Benincasa hispida TaxID=102211 RepID=UPI00190245D2|nr:uncharacterized protein LOC120074406 isoform X2 [Benincasa hispida]